MGRPEPPRIVADSASTPGTPSIRTRACRKFMAARSCWLIQSWTVSDERCGRRAASVRSRRDRSGVVGSGVRRHRGVAISGSRDGRGEAGFVLCVRRGPFEERRTQPGSRRGTGCRREGALEENPWAFVALSNKPLQRMNACAARSNAGRAATPRAAPAAPRGRGTIARPFGVHR